MERGSFIFAAGFTIMVGLYALNMTRIDGGGTDNSARYAEKRQARQISLAALQFTLNSLRGNQNFSGFTDSDFLGGTATVTVVNIGSDQRRITAYATYGNGQEHETESIIQLQQPNSPLQLIHYSAVHAQGRDFEVDPNNKFYVDGRDTASGFPDPGYGIGTSPNLTATAVINELDSKGAAGKVVGLGSTPSVKTLDSAQVIDMTTQAREVQRAATIVHRNGTLGRNRYWGDTLNYAASSEVVFVTKTLTVDKKLFGAGILCIDGNLTVKNGGQIVWYGYVIVRGNDLRVTGGSMRVVGTVYFGKGGDLEFGSNTNLNIYYSTEVLNTLDGVIFDQPGKPSIVRVFD